MISILVQGLLLGIAYVAPIGMQNVYVINSGLSFKKSKAYLVAFIIAFFDITLAFACYYGIGEILSRFDIFYKVMLIVGSIAMVIIGVNLLRAKIKSDRENFKEESYLKIIYTAMVVTWFNPQAVIDGTLLLGGFRASITEHMDVFILGVSIASLSWFLFVITLTTTLKKSFNDKVLKMINVLSGLIIIGFAVKLILTV